MSGSVPRQPHAVLDLASRRAKALKIERLLQLDQRTGPLRMLEVGTGSGGIAHYFGSHPSRRFEVQAVDVVDNRLVTEGYGYRNVTGIDLPFPDRHFDVVLSNHVIEHVGERPDQMRHLAELHRVMAGDGMGYLAVPNRWMVVEPHFRLAFLSWLPRSLRSPYVRLAGRGKHYDCEPLRLPELESMLAATGFRFENLGVQATRQFMQIERPRSFAAAVLRRMPDWPLGLLGGISPTLIYGFRK